MTGGGEILIAHETLRAVHEHVEHARTKYPWPSGMTDAEKYRIAERELQEMGVAMLKGDARGVRDEALDCVAVLVRIAEGE